MTSNELVELMKEYGVKVQMLGTHEKPDPMSIKVVDMLTEIHDLRTRLAVIGPEIRQQVFAELIADLDNDQSDDGNHPYNLGISDLVESYLRARKEQDDAQ